MNLQPGLFDPPRLEFDRDLRGLRRIPLGPGGWADHCSGWLGGHLLLFQQLRHGLTWTLSSRQMYDRVVDVPRMIARVPDDERAPPVIAAMASVLSRHYDRPLFRVSANLYRDGQDSVALHGDKLPDRSDAIVAIVSLGDPRRFLLRPVDRRSADNPRGHTFHLGRGDLLVMGGDSQQTWLHGVPKSPGAGPRLSIMFRQGLPD